MDLPEAVRKLQAALSDFYHALEAEGVPWAATIADAATDAAIKTQSECHTRETVFGWSTQIAISESDESR